MKKEQRPFKCTLVGLEKETPAWKEKDLKKKKLGRWLLFKENLRKKFAGSPEHSKSNEQASFPGVVGLTKTS